MRRRGAFFDSQMMYGAKTWRWRTHDAIRMFRRKRRVAYDSRDAPCVTRDARSGSDVLCGCNTSALCNYFPRRAFRFRTGCPSLTRGVTGVRWHTRRTGV